MACRFLRKDYDALLAKIEELASAVREDGEEKGEWANQSAETWHDNFGYEQAQQQQWAHAERLEDFVRLRNAAEIVDQRVAGEVDIGAEVTIRDRRSGEQKTLLIGSYQVLDQRQDNEISYAAPLASRLMGATEGEEREVTVGDRTTVYRIVRIE